MKIDATELAKAVYDAVRDRDDIIRQKDDRIIHLRYALQQIVGYASVGRWGRWRSVVTNYAKDVL